MGINPNNKIGTDNSNSLSKFLKLILIPLNNKPDGVDVFVCETTPVSIVISIIALILRIYFVRVNLKLSRLLREAPLLL